MKNIIVIVGPTGVGKTKLSVELAKQINAEIINADSMQFYKELNIGTAKIKEEEKEGITHHLFDIKEPTDMYTIYDYQKDGRSKIKEILNKNKRVIIVGGSGLYIKSLLYDYELKEEDKKYDLSNKTSEELYNEIKKNIPDYDVHINNRKRLERTYVKILNNNYISNRGNNPIYDFDIIGLTTSRDNLYNIINNRVDKMIKEGLIEEVKSLFDKKIYSKAIQTGIGYKELYEYFEGKIDLNDAIEKIKTNSRRYAKRQYTFFNNQMNIKWFNTNYDDFSITVNEVLNYIKR